MKGRPEFDVIGAEPSPGPARTSSGDPWVKWEKHLGMQGWVALGTRRSARGTTFWQVTYSIAVAALGGLVDQVHCSPGILSMGGLGVTLRSGYAQLLLHKCLVADPVRFLDVMAPVIHLCGAHTKICERSPSGVALADDKGRPVTSEEGLRNLVLLGGGPFRWTNPQKQRARIWVSSVSRLLRDERMDRAQVDFAAMILPELLDEDTRELLRWPKHGAEDTWQYPREHQALWAFYLVLSMRFPELARSTLTGADQEPSDVLRLLKLRAETNSFQAGITLPILGLVTEGFGL
jgi:hypothetical protein